MLASIIMSVYNREDFIEECISSILKQTFDDFELIIIDDNSNDKTCDIINSFNDSRIKLIKNDENLGLTKNLNYALKIAKGKYIVRMDDDDICYPNRLEIEIRKLEKNKKCDLICSQVNAIGTKRGLCSINYDNSLFIQTYLSYRNNIFHPTVIFRNGKNIFYDEHYLKSQDYELWSRLAFENEYKFSYIKRPLLYYRYHNLQTNKKLQNDYGIEILSRNYNYFFDGFDQKLFDIHTSLIGYKNIQLFSEDIKYFYFNFVKNYKYNKKYLKVILLFELYKECKKKNVKYPFTWRLLLSLFRFKNLKMVIAILRMKRRMK